MRKTKKWTFNYKRRSSGRRVGGGKGSMKIRRSISQGERGEEARNGKKGTEEKEGREEKVIFADQVSE